jgi:hypothetical protein
MIDIDGRIQQFKIDILKYSEEEMIQRCFEHVLEPFCMTTDNYFELKNVISSNFGLHPNDVTMVGSGKLGFTLKPKVQFRKFNDKSDIDMAIISEKLYEKIWKDVFVYKNQVKYWPEEFKFKDYFFRGWIRPDYLPPAFSFDFANNWWEFFRQLTKSGKYGPYKIKAGLYYSRFFFEAYQHHCMTICKQLLSGGIN